MMFLYSFPVNYEFYHKKSIHIAIGTSAAAVMNCILNYVLIPVMGMAGAAVATLIAYVMLWIFIIWCQNILLDKITITEYGSLCRL